MVLRLSSNLWNLENVESLKKIFFFSCLWSFLLPSPHSLFAFQRTRVLITPFHPFLSTVLGQDQVGFAISCETRLHRAERTENPGHGLQIMKHRWEQDIGYRYQLEPRFKNLFCPHPKAETGDRIIQFPGKIGVDVDPSAPMTLVTMLVHGFRSNSSWPEAGFLSGRLEPPRRGGPGRRSACLTEKMRHNECSFRSQISG